VSRRAAVGANPALSSALPAACYDDQQSFDPNWRWRCSARPCSSWSRPWPQPPWPVLRSVTRSQRFALLLPRPCPKLVPRRRWPWPILRRWPWPILPSPRWLSKPDRRPSSPRPPQRLRPGPRSIASGRTTSLPISTPTRWPIRLRWTCPCCAPPTLAMRRRPRSTASSPPGSMRWRRPSSTTW